MCKTFKDGPININFNSLAVLYQPAKQYCAGFPCPIGADCDEIRTLASGKDVEIHYELVKSSAKDMKSIADLLATGKIQSHISKIFNFEKMGEAHLEIENGHTVGKVVVLPPNH